MLKVAIGGAIEAYDLFIFSYFSIYIAHTFFKTTDLSNALLGTNFIFFLSNIVRPLGGLIFGYIGDFYSRRKALSISIWTMTMQRIFRESLAVMGSNFGMLSASIICWLTSLLFSCEDLYNWAWCFPFILSVFGCLAGVLLSKLPVEQSATKGQTSV